MRKTYKYFCGILRRYNYNVKLLEAVEKDKIYISSTTISPVPPSKTNKVNSTTENLAVKFASKEELGFIKKARKEKAIVELALINSHEDCKTILIEYFCNRKKINIVADELAISYSTFQRRKGELIRQCRKQYNKFGK